MLIEGHTLSPDESFGVFNRSSGTFVLPALPFEVTALVPITGAETLGVHLGKHHQAYVDGANRLMEPMAKKFETAIEVISFARSIEAHGLLEQAGQALNHAFFWTCHQAAGLTRPEGSLEIAINGKFGDFTGFTDAAIALGKARVGSGWIWLVADLEGAVRLELTQDAETLLDNQSLVVLLVCDIWEHAYYLDRASDRAGWIDGFFGQLADWSMAKMRYEDGLRREPDAVSNVS